MGIDLVFKSPTGFPTVREKVYQGWSFEDIVKSHTGGPFSVLLGDLGTLYGFRFSEIDILQDIQILDPDYLRTLYKMGIVSTSRIRRFVEEMKTPYVSSRIEKLCEEGFHLFGVIFGSTGRFEATTRSDFEYTFIFYPSDRSRLGRKETAYLRRVMNEDIKCHVEKEFLKWMEFKGSHICGIDEKSISRSWSYTLKTKRTGTCMYFLAYCFFEYPLDLFKQMKRVYLSEIGIAKIIGNEYLAKIKGRKLDSLLKGKITTIPKFDLKRIAINTVQALALLELKEEAGHSLIEDVFKLFRNGALDKTSTRKILASILEAYKARRLYDLGRSYDVKNPTLLEGFRIAFEKVKERLELR